MIGGLLSAFVLLSAGIFLLLALLRLLLVFSSARNLFDGGQRDVSPLLERAAVSAGSKKVTIVVDLAVSGEEGSPASASASTVAIVKTLLSQRYRNLEVIAISSSDRLPTDLQLAFDLTEAGTGAHSLVYRSVRDPRFLCVVPDQNVSGGERFSTGVAVASGDLICPISADWDLRPNAIAELSAPWVRSPELAASFGVLHSREGGVRQAGALVSARSDLLVVAGLRGGAAALAALGSLASGQHGAMIAIVARPTLKRIGGLAGPVADPRTWSVFGEALARDCLDRGLASPVRIVSRPLGRIANSERSSVGPSVFGSPRWNGRFLIAAGTIRIAHHMGPISALGVTAGLIGGLSGTVPSDVLWIAASAPVLLAVVVVIGLMIDDRAMRPVGRTRYRLQMLGGALAAALWGVVGSPLRWSPSKLH